MQDNTKTDAPRQTAPSAGRPPPLPSSKAKPVAGGGQLAKARAFLEIRRLRLSNALRDLGHRVRRHKLAAGIGGVAVALAVAGGIAFAFDALPDLDFAFSSPETVAEATRNVREHPSDAGAQRDLGHALFAAKRRAGGVAAYRHALTLDAGAGDERMVKNLLSCFGTPQQDAAEDAIWKNKLVEAQQGLEALVSSRRSSVRWGAVQTLDRLRKGTKANWETAYILDLDSSKCEVRRRAVEKLGDIGAQRAVKALRAAKADDEKTGGWFSSRCLGDRLETAEKQIVARR